MKIRTIEINNMGPYGKSVLFDFETILEKNIILIGGKNGAGKTTLLKCIKYGLFGSYSLGLKNNTKVYNDEIKQLLSNRVDRESDFYIQIDVEFYEKYTKHNYLIRRNWKFVKDDIEENVCVFDSVNNILLNDFQSNEILEKIRAISSPDLINSFIFDGEKISDIITKDTIDEYLKNNFNSIFNINLLEQLRIDLLNYLNKQKEKTENGKEIEAITMLNDISKLKKELLSHNSYLKDLTLQYETLKVQRRNVEKEFYVLGGLSKEKIKNIQKKISDIQKKKDYNSKRFREIVENDLPLIMNIKLLVKAIQQAKDEEPLNYVDYISEIEAYLNTNFEEIKIQLQKSIIDLNKIQCITKDDVNSMIIRLEELRKNKKFVVDYIKSNNTNSIEYAVLREKLTNNESVKKLESLDKQMEKINLACLVKESEIEKTNKKISLIKHDLDNIISVFNTITDELRKNNLNDNSFKLATKYLELEEEFNRKLVNSKLAKVSKIATMIFNKTIRKDNYISKISIDSNYQLILLDNNLKKIDNKILSAGEMQILMASLIWAMFRVAKRREMFIFDTPLARLDIENRNNFIDNIVKTISNQVIILSTDSEIVGDVYNSLMPNLKKTYLLSYDEKTGFASVSKKYFEGDK